MDSVGAPPVSSQRRIVSRRLARVLLRAYVEVGWVSTCLRVRVGTREVAPDLAATTGEPPVDGRQASAPRLVVLLRPISAPRLCPREWLDAGAAAVWEVGHDVVVEHRVTGPTALRRSGEQMAAPSGRCPIAVDALLAETGSGGARLG